MRDYTEVDKDTAFAFVRIFPGNVTCDSVWVSPWTGSAIKHFSVNGVVVMVHEELSDSYSILNLEKAVKTS